MCRSTQQRRKSKLNESTHMSAHTSSETSSSPVGLRLDDGCFAVPLLDGMVVMAFGGHVRLPSSQSASIGDTAKPGETRPDGVWASCPFSDRFVTSSSVEVLKFMQDGSVPLGPVGPCVGLASSNWPRSTPGSFKNPSWPSSCCSRVAEVVAFDQYAAFINHAFAIVSIVPVPNPPVRPLSSPPFPRFTPLFSRLSPFFSAPLCLLSPPRLPPATRGQR